MHFSVIFLMCLPAALFGETEILNDLEPEAVQARLAAQSLDLKYAKFLGQRTLPAEQAAVAFADGRIAGNPEDYLQNSYQANQFHGQDGLGRAMFGYSDWNQGRLEARNANGDVRGSYQYVDAFGEQVIVNYWADSLGFHQTDNRQAPALQSVTETPEVQAARLAHERAWAAAAQASQQSPDPMSDVYNANANRLDEERSEYEQAQQILAQQQVPNQYLSGLKTIPTANRIGVPLDAADDTDSVLVQSAGIGAESRRQQQYQRVRLTPEADDSQTSASEDNEVTGPPHGFFYNIDYPVQVVVEHPEIIARRVALGAAAQPERQPQLLERQAQLEQQAQLQRQAQLERQSQLERQPQLVKQPSPQLLSLRRPSIVAPTQPLQLLSGQPTSIINGDDGTATNEEFKIVPIRILDTKKFKRSDQNLRRRQAAAIRNRFQRQNVAPAPIRITKRSSAAAQTARPIAADQRNGLTTNTPSKIIQIETTHVEQQQPQQQHSLPELQRLASINADAVDGIHDAQVHPKQAARIAAANAAARKYRSYF